MFGWLSGEHADLVVAYFFPRTQGFPGFLHCPPGFKDFVTVFQAQLPLLKLADINSVDIDICVDNMLGYHNSLLMGSYARVDKRVPEFIRRVKCFAKRLEIVGSTDGHLNSYAWTLLAVYFLMHSVGRKDLC